MKLHTNLAFIQTYRELDDYLAKLHLIILADLARFYAGRDTKTDRGFIHPRKSGLLVSREKQT